MYLVLWTKDTRTAKIAFRKFSQMLDKKLNKLIVIEFIGLLSILSLVFSFSQSQNGIFLAARSNISNDILIANENTDSDRMTVEQTSQQKPLDITTPEPTNIVTESTISSLYEDLPEELDQSESPESQTLCYTRQQNSFDLILVSLEQVEEFVVNNYEEYVYFEITNIEVNIDNENLSIWEVSFFGENTEIQNTLLIDQNSFFITQSDCEVEDTSNILE